MADDNLVEILGFDPDQPHDRGASGAGYVEAKGIPENVKAAFQEGLSKKFGLSKVFLISPDNLFSSTEDKTTLRKGVYVPDYQRTYERYFCDDEDNVLFEKEKSVSFSSLGPEEGFFRWHDITIDYFSEESSAMNGFGRERSSGLGTHLSFHRGDTPLVEGQEPTEGMRVDLNYDLNDRVLAKWDNKGKLYDFAYTPFLEDSEQMVAYSNGLRLATSDAFRGSSGLMGTLYQEGYLKREGIEDDVFEAVHDRGRVIIKRIKNGVVKDELSVPTDLDIKKLVEDLLPDELIKDPEHAPMEADVNWRSTNPFRAVGLTWHKETKDIEGPPTA